MPPSSPRGLVIDTGFWIEAFDPSREHHQTAAKSLEALRNAVILMPWPIMYEVLRTKTVKNPPMVRAFERIMRQRKVLKVDDANYRDECLESTIRHAAVGRRSISLVDMVVRALIGDTRYRITRLWTFNAQDFHDVCRSRGVVLEAGGSARPG